MASIDLMEIVLAAGATATGGLLLTGRIRLLSDLSHSTLFGGKINSQEELERIVAEEAQRLSLDMDTIAPVYGTTITTAVKRGRRYFLYMEDSWTATRATVRRELYHILKDCDREPAFFYDRFVAEPRAHLYGAFNIRV